VKKGIIRAGTAVLILIVLALVVPFLAAWISPDVHPIATQGTVIRIYANCLVIHASDGMDIQINLREGQLLPYLAENGTFYYIPVHTDYNNKTEKFQYDLIGVKDSNPALREKATVAERITGGRAFWCNNGVCTTDVPTEGK
jgi:hypothetical protein